MSATVVTYRVKEGRAEENAGFVRAVYAELAERRPAEFTYSTWLAEDGVTFTHIAFTEGDAAAPLPELAAFRAFQQDLGERCAEPPRVTKLPENIGRYPA